MRWFSKLIAFALVASACTQTPPVISLDPAMVELEPGAQQKFMVTLTNAKSTAVRWSATGGTIDDQGVFTAGQQEGSFRVGVAMVDQPEVTTTASVTIKKMGPSVTVTPKVAQVKSTGIIYFSANVVGLDDDGVEWSVVEAEGGQIDPAGAYTAPEKLGTYTVRATSAVDKTLFDEAKVTVVQNVPLVIAPARAEIRAGEQVRFSAISTESSVGDVQWDMVERMSPGNLSQDGLYVASTTTGGLLHVRATSKANPALTATAELSVAYAPIRLAGTATYTGPTKGPIIIGSLYTSNSSPGISLRQPGPYVMEGFEDDRLDFFWSYIDSGGGNNTNAHTPFMFIPFDPTKPDQTDFELTDLPAPTTATAEQTATISQLVSDQNAVAMVFESGKTPDLEHMGEGHRVYWSKTPNPGPTNTLGVIEVPQNDYIGNHRVVIDGLTAGDQYYFTVSTMVGTQEFGYQAATMPATVGMHAAGSIAVRGQVKLGAVFQTLTAKSRLYVYAGVIDLSDVKLKEYRFASLGKPTAANVPYEIDNLEADKQYMVTYFLDMNGDGAFTYGVDRRGNMSEMQVVSSAAVPSAVDLALTQGRSEFALKQVVNIDQGQKNYRVDVLIHPGSKVPFNLMRRATSDHNYKQHTMVYQFGNCWYPDCDALGAVMLGTNRAKILFGTKPFTAGLKYAYDLEYTDGTTETREVTVPWAPVEIELKQPLAAAGQKPTFKWSALPAGVNATQTLKVGDDTGTQWSYQIPAGVTEVVFNADGTANNPELAAGHPATWSISTVSPSHDIMSTSSWTFAVQPGGQ